MRKFLAILSVLSLSLSLANAEETTTTLQDDGISKKWEFKFDVGGQGGFSSRYDESYGTKDGDDALLLDLGAGYNFNSNIYLGVASGYWYKAGHGTPKENNLVPVLGDFVYRWNVGSKQKWSIFAEAQAGYLFSTRSDTKFHGSDYEYHGYTYLGVMPGVYYRIKKNIDLRFSLGYGYFISRDDYPLDLAHNERTFNVKLGMNFRRAPKAIVRTTPVEEPVAAPVEEVKQEPAPTTKIVETTTEEQRQLGMREVVIYYLIRQHNILPEKDALLQDLADFAKTHKTTKVIVKSYADKGTGNYKLNQMYSRNRMNEVRKHLVEKYGIPEDQIESSYYGDTVQPYEENDLNRCSIIVVKEIE